MIPQRRHIHIAGKAYRDNSDKMAILNGKIRDREKKFRGLKKIDAPVIDGMKAYCNFTKKQSASKCKISAHMSLIEVVISSL